jgi:tRNA (uracil-5-)-methyltransferase
MKFNDLATGTITRFDRKGRGVFDVPLQNGRTRPFLVPFTTIGDEIEAAFLKRQEGSFIGKLTRIIKSGPSRIQDHRQQTTDNGLKLNPGTLWAHINYDDQLAFKRDLINRAFEEAGHHERINEVIPAPEQEYYRNRMDYAFGWKGELGLKEYGSWNRYLDLDDCTLLSPDVPKILTIFRDFMKRFPELKPWDAKKHEGDLRYAVIREGKNTGDRLIALVVKCLNRVTDEARAWLKDRLDAHANNIVLAENPAISDLSYGRTIVPLKGKETIEEVINGTRYVIQLNSFFQTNSVMAAKLQDTVANFVSESLQPIRPLPPRSARCQGPQGMPTTYPLQPILDLYCGLGFFAIDLARRFPNIKAIGYEVYENMIKLAKRNAEQNGVADRTEFFSGKAEALDWQNVGADAVIVDPPRAGLHPKVIRTLLERKPETIIYVSCNYHRLAHELKEFKKKYQIKDLKALDLFPDTPHAEMAVKLQRK